MPLGLFKAHLSNTNENILVYLGKAIFLTFLMQI